MERRPVARRRVFYIPGYDPFPPRRYRELYRKEGAAQAAISGYDIALAPGGNASGYGWTVRAQMDGHAVEAQVTVLQWADIVRGSMRPGVLPTYLLLARTFWTYLSTGAMSRLFRLRKGPVIAAMYPVVMLVGQLGLALLAAWVVAAAAGLWLPGWAAWLPGLALAAAMLEGFRRIDGRFFVYYLLHDYAFTARLRGAHPPELDARLDSFADTIAAALASEVDEVLVVGHSSGAHLAVSTLARLLRQDRLPAVGGPALGLLTLGQVIPMQSFLPEANGLRDDLHLMSQDARLTWIDITAPGDGCCFALCDPVAVSGAAGPDKRWPLVISAAFSQTLRPETWARLRRRYFRLHFQYLCAFDAPGDYDYFQITAGPRRLADRYAGRKPSPGRIEQPMAPRAVRCAA